MVGIILVTHDALARSLLETTELIVGSLEQVAGIAIGPADDVEDIQRRIGEAVENVNTGEGVLILTDMFGGTASNLSLAFLEQGKVEVLSGVNLPMLIKIPTARQERSLNELAEFLQEYGQKNISVASQLLKGRTK